MLYGKELGLLKTNNSKIYSFLDENLNQRNTGG
jgi:hypothetical protein